MAKKPSGSKRKRERTPVGEPLAPAILGQMGALGRGWPHVPDGFDPLGRWAATWRVWTCHGYLRSGNADRGWLRIERVPSGGGSTFVLGIEQRITHDRGPRHTLTARIACLNDALATPQRWTVASSFEDPPQAGSHELAQETAGERRRVPGRGPRGGEVVITTNGSTDTLGTVDALAAEWALYEAVQRLPLETGRDWRFDMLEDLTLLRPAQRLWYRGIARVRVNGGSLQLHRFSQTGRGTFPFDWWLDRSRRLVLMTSHSAAYVLDPTVAERRRP